MNITINIVESIKKVQEFKEYDLGQITTTLQDLLDNSSIIIDSNIIPILKVLSIDNVPKSYLIKDLSESLYNTGDYITGQDLIEENLILIGGDTQNSEIEINTAFVNKPYSSIMNIVHDNINPNFEIDLTGNLDLTITGTSNGDSGMVNLYFSGNEVVTLNGFGSLEIIGAGEMIPVYFIHDSDGLRWYSDAISTVDTSIFALKDGTILYHTFVATNVGTFSNVGNVCTGVGTTITSRMVGAKITKANGEKAIIATRTSDTSFTTVEPFTTDSIDTAFIVNCVAIKVGADGLSYFYDRNGKELAYIEANGFGIDSFKFVNETLVSTIGTTFISKDHMATDYFGLDKKFTVAELATYGFPFYTGENFIVAISDALNPTYRGILVGGGTVNCMAYWDGTNWRT